MEESIQFKPVVGYQGFYEVSEFGEVRRVGRGHGSVAGRILKITTMPRGYKTVNLWKSNKGKTCLVHRLVASAFIGLAKEKHVNHIDGNKSNNHFTNLEYVTPKENTAHAIRTGLMNSRGVNNSQAKIDEETVRAIRKKHMEGMGYKRLSKHFGLTWGLVRSVVTRKTWKHVE